MIRTRRLIPVSLWRAVAVLVAVTAFFTVLLPGAGGDLYAATPCPSGQACAPPGSSALMSLMSDAYNKHAFGVTDPRLIAFYGALGWSCFLLGLYVCCTNFLHSGIEMRLFVIALSIGSFLMGVDCLFARGYYLRLPGLVMWPALTGFWWCLATVNAGFQRGLARLLGPWARFLIWVPASWNLKVCPPDCPVVKP